MKLYNTLPRSIEEIKPAQPPEITVYSCGPTVYDYPHIGNWFTFIRYDVLIRALKASGLQPKWVINITDVGHLVSDADEGEDKLEKGAKREGKSAWDIANFYTDYFTKSLSKLNITSPDNLPRATEHIDEQIELVKKLESKGFTYKTSDGIYFDTSKLSDYGKLARLDIEHLRAGARVEVNPEKRHPTDFALWKLSPKGKKRDMEWDSPWGMGFPGWHLECSAMAMKYLGETLDIHAGGIDHIPVHHTNEIAQSEAATGKPFANYWFHSNFVLTDNQKMAKSADNFLTLEDIEKRDIDLMAFRLLVLESHYQTEAHLSWDNLEAAQNRLKHWQAVADLRWQSKKSVPLDASIMNKSVQNNLDTPKVLSIIDNYLAEVEKNNAYPDTKTLKNIEALLGINLLREDISEKIKTILDERQKARDEKDFKKSDELRDELKEQGIGVRDTDNGQIWFRL